MPTSFPTEAHLLERPPRNLHRKSTPVLQKLYQDNFFLYLLSKSFSLQFKPITSCCLYPEHGKQIISFLSEAFYAQEDLSCPPLWSSLFGSNKSFHSIFSSQLTLCGPCSLLGCSCCLGFLKLLLNFLDTPSSEMDTIFQRKLSSTAEMHPFHNIFTYTIMLELRFETVLKSSIKSLPKEMIGDTDCKQDLLHTEGNWVVLT